MSRRNFSVPACLLLLLANPLLSAPPSTDPLQEFPSRVKKVTLKNGLRVLMVERPASPTVSFAMFIRTGALDDKPGKSGIAHMFEHMLFKGTKTVGTKDSARESVVLDAMDNVQMDMQREKDKGEKADRPKLRALEEKWATLESEHQELLVPEEFWKIYERAGAEDFNAGTGHDFTTYTVSLPKNEVTLWMAMESDRLKNPVLREFYKERDVVLEERRLRIDNDPSGKLSEGFLAAAFMIHPYRKPIIGWASEVARLTRSDAERFFKNHYDVSRLVVGIVGGFDTTEMETQLRQYFGPIPSAPSNEEAFVPPEPVQEGEKRIVVQYDAQPRLMIGFHRPDMLHPDSPALDVAADILSSGRTSRLVRNVVEKKRVAVSAWASSSYPGDRDPNLFVMGGDPRTPHTTGDVETALYAELERLKKDGPSSWELEKVKNNLEANLIRSLSSNSGLASQLAYYEAVAGDWTILLDLFERIRAVTAADVKRVVGTYLKPSNRTVATLVQAKTK
ncbi:MAG: insulinase family protein [Elusimicrobia bacterium]|nr:insulinase family protein [Candidatus Obscuribacterium magneticum]